MTSSFSTQRKLSSSPLRCRSDDDGGTNFFENPSLRRLLNRLSSLVAIVGITRFCVLCGQGEYDSWAAPLLLSGAVCKLLTTAEPHNAHLRRTIPVGRGRPRWKSAVPATTLGATRRFRRTAVVRTLSALRRRIDNDNRSGVIFLSLAVVILPCFVYFFGKVAPLLRPEVVREKGINHRKLANDFGKLGAAGLAFLLVPVSKFSSLLAAWRFGEVHAIRLHTAAGCVVLFGGLAHGLYYTYIWIEVKEYSYGDVFPSGECWRGLTAREYDKDCHLKLVNLLGIVCGVSLLALGLSSLHRVRRRFYRLFYAVHVAVSVVLLFGLAMHYNKMILYMAPSLLYYMASNAPVHVEGAIKRWRSRRRGGIALLKATCVPDSGGCVELSFATTTGRTDAGDDELARAEEDFRSHLSAVGAYVELRVPELSAKGHPFTAFSDPRSPSESTRVLFRPCGRFTTALSKRFRELASLPEPTPSEVENHGRTFDGASRRGSFGSFLRSDVGTPPTMLANGMRSAAPDMFEKAMSHDRIVIFAGGVGIVSYISLIHALRLQSELTMTKQGNHGDNMSNGHPRPHDNEEDLVGGHLENGRNDFILGSAVAAKQVDVHWMSRDEGLVWHVLQNYFEPFASHSLVNDDASRRKPPSMSIDLVVHHTSPRASASMNSNSPRNDDANDGEATTTWRPGRQNGGGGGTTSTSRPDEDRGPPPSFALPSSAYEGNAMSPLRNVAPAAAFAAIAFGGLWMVDRCYNELQDKHVVETRAVAVAGVWALALAASLVSNVVLVAGESFYSGWLSFAYSKLDQSGGPRNDRGEIECSDVATTTADTGNGMPHPFSIDGEDVAAVAENGLNGVASDCPESLSAPKALQVDADDAVLRVTHVWGRPDLAAIVRDSVIEGGRDREVALVDDEVRDRDGSIADERGRDRGSKDIGVFVCGPAAVSEAVLDVIEKEESKSRFCRGSNNTCNKSWRKPVAVYREVFEK